MSGFTEGFELADGTALSTANLSGSFSANVSGGVASTASPLSGLGSAFGRIDTTGAAALVEWRHDLPDAPQTSYYMRAFARVRTRPAANRVIFALRTSANANVIDLRLRNGGQLQLRNSSSASQGVTETVPLDTWVRMEVDAVAGATELRYYLDPWGATPTSTVSGTYATTDVGRVLLGLLASDTMAVDFDGIEGSTAALGAVSPPSTGVRGFWSVGM